MGQNNSVGNITKREITTKPSKPNKNNLLFFNKCIFLTYEQYSSKSFLPSNMFYINEVVKINEINTIEKYVYRKIKEISVLYSSLIEKEESLRVYKKIPGPIYVMYAKKIEYEKNVFDFIEAKDKPPEFDNDINMLINEKDLKKSVLSVYRFNGNYDIYIFFPNLNKDCKLICNLDSLTSINSWMSNLLNNKNYFSIVSMLRSRNNTKQLLNSMEIYDEKIIDNVYKFAIEKETIIYPFIRESNNACYEEGCVCDYGEDLNYLIPSYTYDSSILKKNANDMAPFFPNKCLRRRNYEDNMFKIDDKYLKNMSIALIECYKVYKQNKLSLEKGNTDNLENTQENLLDVFKDCVNKYNKKMIVERGDQNEDYKYSVDYNNNVLVELSKRQHSYPGIQEFSFPLFVLNYRYRDLKDYICFMPWGNNLLNSSYVLNTGTELKEEEYIKSFNNVMKLKLNKNGNIVMYKNDKILYYLNDKDFSDYSNKFLILDGVNINLYGGDNVLLWVLKIADASSFNIVYPISLLIENNGMINIYDNGFNIVSSKDLNININLDIDINTRNIKLDFKEDKNIYPSETIVSDDSKNQLLRYLSRTNKPFNKELLKDEEKLKKFLDSEIETYRSQYNYYEDILYKLSYIRQNTF